MTYEAEAVTSHQVDWVGFRIPTARAGVGADALGTEEWAWELALVQWPSGGLVAGKTLFSAARLRDKMVMAVARL